MYDSATIIDPFMLQLKNIQVDLNFLRQERFIATSEEANELDYLEIFAVVLARLNYEALIRNEEKQVQELSENEELNKPTYFGLDVEDFLKLTDRVFIRVTVSYLLLAMLARSRPLTTYQPLVNSSYKSELISISFPQALFISLMT